MSLRDFSAAATMERQSKSSGLKSGKRLSHVNLVTRHQPLLDLKPKHCIHQRSRAPLEWVSVLVTLVCGEAQNVVDFRSGTPTHATIQPPPFNAEIICPIVGA